MNELAGLYFPWGWEHILGTEAADHILFLIALCAHAKPETWRRLAVLVTAFTLGHLLSLALSVSTGYAPSATWVEFLIPLSIVLMALSQLLPPTASPAGLFRYGIVLGFGLIHGLGFATVIRFTLAETDTVSGPLLFFHLGIECAQLLVIAALLLVRQIFTSRLGCTERTWSVTLSLLSLLGGLYFCLTRLPGGTP